MDQIYIKTRNPRCQIFLKIYRKRYLAAGFICQRPPIRVQWFSQLDEIHHAAKRCQIIISKMFAKKFFQLVKPFLANLHSTTSNIYPYMYSMTPKFFLFFFGIRVFKIRRILRWFQICGNNRKKNTPRKSYLQNTFAI